MVRIGQQICAHTIKRLFGNVPCRTSSLPAALHHPRNDDDIAFAEPESDCSKTDSHDMSKRQELLLRKYMAAGQSSRALNKIFEWRRNGILVGDNVIISVMRSPSRLGNCTLASLSRCILNPTFESRFVSEVSLIRSSAQLEHFVKRISVNDICPDLLYEVVMTASRTRTSSCLPIVQSSLITQLTVAATRSQSKEILGKSVGIFIRLHLMNNSAHLLDETFSIIGAEKIPLRTADLAGAFSVHRSGSNIDEVFAVFSKCRRLGLLPDAAMFMDLLETVSKSLSPLSSRRYIIRSILRELYSSDVALEGNLLNVVFSTFASAAMSRDSLKFVIEASSLGSVITQDLVCSLIRGCSSQYRHRTALYYLEASEAVLGHLDVKMDAHGYRCLLPIYASFGLERANVANNLYTQLISSNNTSLETNIAKLRISDRDIDEVMDALPRSTSFGQLRLTKEHFLVAFRSFARTGRFDFAEQMLIMFNEARRRRSFLILPDAECITSVYNLVLRSADQRQFPVFLNQMIYTDKVQPDSGTLLSIYHHCTSSGIAYWHSTKPLIDVVQPLVRVDAQVCLSAVKRLIQLRLFSEAVHLISISRRSRHNRARVYQSTYRHLLGSLSSSSLEGLAQTVLDMKTHDNIITKSRRLEPA
uniref:Pentacotripeptide-repeat region of PRORP domain-containing protein n=1 Tax=Spongospora subterranea TaxID=70186 RepID=A0A0H5QST0_9EUKA|eukprot:CRZ04742.1 hypothetical protein [Spongospora subterranea]